MNQKRILVLILLTLIFLTSVGTFAYVEQQSNFALIEKAQASEIQQSQLTLIEEQIRSQETVNSDSESLPALEPNNPSSVEEPKDEDIEAQNPPTQDGDFVVPEGFVNQKAPEISPTGAQTTVNLIITDPEAEE